MWEEGFPFQKKSSQFTDTGWKWVNCNWEFISEVLITYSVKTKLTHTVYLGNKYYLNRTLVYESVPGLSPPTER